MKNLTLAASLLIVTLASTTSGQVKSVVAANNQPTSMAPAASQNPANATRVRVLGQDAKAVAPIDEIASAATVQDRAKTDFNNHAESAGFRRGRAALDKASPNLASDGSKAPRKLKSTSSNSATPSSNSVVNSNTSIAAGSSRVYRVGVRDVLDIQLEDNPSRLSTLFTVLEGGLLEYPLAGSPIPVAGMTTQEIAVLLRQRIKVFDNPSVVVNVRDYASHVVAVTGFVAAPGVKTLHREAVPLYAVLAEALVLPEAACATINRQGRSPIVVNLKDANLSSTLIIPGDAIKVSGVPAPTEFFFVGGEINSPGQKAYHTGLTLTQAILASGGTNMSAGSKVRVSRQGPDGRLVTEEYNLRKIQTGKIPDPALQKGDRIEVGAAY